MINNPGRSHESSHGAAELPFELKPEDYMVLNGVYSAVQIRQAMTTGQIVIHPFIPQSLQQTSYDVALGPHFYRTNQSPASFYDWTSETAIAEYFGYERAIPHSELKDKYKIQGNVNFTDDRLSFYLAPGERVLAHTMEFIGINAPGTTQMQALSTIGRNGIAVCFDAGWGDPGYINRWTMEIMNVNDTPVLLGVGGRIAQIIFYAAGPSGAYGDRSGNYQSSKDLDTLIEEWQPELMLPRSHLDEPVFSTDEINEFD